MRLKSIFIWLAAAGCVVGIAAGATALAGNSTSTRSGGQQAAPPSPAAPTDVSKADSRRIAKRREAAERRARFRASAAQSRVVDDFAVFRSEAGARDIAPSSRPGALSRRVRTADPAAKARALEMGRITAEGADVFLYLRADNLCVEAGAGVACAGVTTKPPSPLLAAQRSDGTGEVVWGAVPDGVVSVDIVTSTGSKVTVQPADNLFMANLDGTISEVVYDRRDGSAVEVVG